MKQNIEDKYANSGWEILSLKTKFTSRLPALMKDHFQFRALPLSLRFSLAIWSNFGDESFFESLGA